MVRVGIVEDDEQYIGQLQAFLTEYTRRKGESFHTRVYRNGQQLVFDYQPDFDILLMDIEIRNYCEDVPVLTDGLPQTSKEKNGYHGYGLLSIRSTAEKYGGDIRIDTGENSFTLQILLPA